MIGDALHPIPSTLPQYDQVHAMRSTLVGEDGVSITVTNGKLDVNAAAPVGGATSDKQTNGSQKTQLVDTAGDGINIFNTYPTGSEYGIPVKSVDGFFGMVDNGNSSSSNLLANATFTGAAIDMLPYASVQIQVYSDKAGATNGMSCQWSPDGVIWDTARQFTVPAGYWLNFTHSVHGRYFRLIYTNGATTTTTLRIQAIVTKSGLTGEIIPVDAQPVSGCDAVLTKSVMSGRTTAGGSSYVDVKVNPSGSLTVENTNTNLPVGTTPTVYNITTTNANTEYSQALPVGTKKLQIQNRGFNDTRYAYAAGKVATPTAPYLTLKSGDAYFEDNLALTGVTLYVASTAGSVVEVLAWA